MTCYKPFIFPSILSALPLVMDSSNDIDWTSVFDDDIASPLANPGSESFIDTDSCFVPASGPSCLSNSQGWNDPTNSIQSSNKPNSLLPHTGWHSNQTYSWPYQFQTTVGAEVAMPPQALAESRDLTSDLHLTTSRINAAAAPLAVAAAPLAAAAAPLAAAAAPLAAAAAPLAAAAAPLAAAAAPSAAAPPPDVAPSAAVSRTLKRKQGPSVDLPADNKRPNLHGKSSAVTRVLVPPPGEDIMKTGSAELLLLLADNSRIIATAKEMATKSNVGLPSSNFLSTFIRRHDITGLMFLTAGFWSLLLGHDSALLRRPNCIPKLTGLLKIVEAARSHSPDYKARVRDWAKVVHQPYDANRAHLFKLKPSVTLLRAISFVIGPVSYAQVKDVSFPGGTCKIRGAHRSRIVTWSSEPEVFMDNEGL